MQFKRAYILGLLLIPQFFVGVLPLNSYPERSLQVAKNSGSKEQEIFRSLNLSPAQLSRMQVIRQKYKARIVQRQQSLRQAYGQLKNLMVGDANARQIRSQHDRVQNLENKLEDVRLESLLEMREVLTPSQRRKLVQMMERKGMARFR